MAQETLLRKHSSYDTAARMSWPDFWGDSRHGMPIPNVARPKTRVGFPYQSFNNSYHGAIAQIMGEGVFSAT